MFLEELASVVLTPFVLYVSLPKCAPAILAFVRDFTVRVDGIGDICSLAAFDLQRHGNAKYGAPSQAPKVCPRAPHEHVLPVVLYTSTCAQSCSCVSKYL